MKYKNKKALKIITCLLIFSFLSIINSGAADTDFGIWNKINLNIPLNDRFKINLDTQYRYQADDHAFPNLFILRPSFGIDLFKGFSFWNGYGYINYDDNEDIFENRIWQQLQHEALFPKLWLVNRFRVEERIFENESVTEFLSGDVGARGKYLIRFMFPVVKKNVFFVLSDEVSFNFNDAIGGVINAGYDGNRLFSGLYAKVNDYLSFETGYQFEHIHFGSKDRLAFGGVLPSSFTVSIPGKEIFNHGVLFNFYLTTPQLFNKAQKPLTTLPLF